MYSTKSGFSPEEREIVRRQMRDLYGNFVAIVAENRGLSEDSVDTIARGRVWSGKTALEIGLADREGDILDAIAEATAQAGIKDDDYEIVELPGRRMSFFNLPDIFMAALTRVFSSDSNGNVEALKLLQNITGDVAPQMRLPYELIIE